MGLALEEVSAAPWPLPSAPMSLVRRWADSYDTRVLHLSRPRPFLDVFVNGHGVGGVPGGIGIDSADPAIGRFEVEGAPAHRAWRARLEGCVQACISPLHTQDVTGVIRASAATASPCERRDVHRRQVTNGKPLPHPPVGSRGDRDGDRRPAAVLFGDIVTTAMLAWTMGSLLAVGLVVVGLLTAYAIYYLVFRLGK
jgi:hypothetical protein